MANYEEAKFKLTNTQLGKLNSTAKIKTSRTSRMANKTFKIKNYLKITLIVKNHSIRRIF